MKRTALHLLLAMALLAALAQPAAAEEGQVTAKVVSFQDTATQEGRLAMAFLLNEPALANEARGASTPWLDIQAGHVEAHLFQGSTLNTAAGRQVENTPRDEPFDLESARLQMTEFQPKFQIHIYSADGDLPYHAEVGGGKLESIDVARMGPSSFGKDTVGADEGPHPSNYKFAVVERPGPLVQQYESSPHLALAVTGSMIVEVQGLTLHASGNGQDRTIATGAWDEPVDPTLPAGSDQAVYRERTSFLRLFLTDASVELAADGGDPTIDLAMHDAVGAFSGEATLLGATGRLKGADGNLDGARHVLPSGSVLDLQPQAGLLAVGVSPPPLKTQGAIARVAAPASAALLGTGAVLALAAAIGVGVLRRVLRLPALADVERAIEEGEYRKAARQAGRILSRLPGSEEALLGRAIALSKGGQPQAVVAELTEHLAKRPASDGTLHYVLGLAQLAVGRKDEGQASLKEAVRLTPALQAEVAPRLGKVFSPPNTTAKETHGYA